MNSFTYHMDLFKSPLTYKINGKDNFSTKFGCMMSIPVIIFLLVSLFMSNLVQKRNPAITIQTISNIIRPYLTFDRTNMTFGVRIADDNAFGNFDPSYFSVTITNVVLNNTSHEIIYYDEKKNKLCDENDFPNSNEFWEYSFTNATCAVNNSYKLGGYWTNPFISMIHVKVNKCKNSSDSNIICKSPEEITAFFNQK